MNEEVLLEERYEALKQSYQELKKEYVELKDGNTKLKTRLRMTRDRTGNVGKIETIKDSTALKEDVNPIYVNDDVSKYAAKLARENSHLLKRVRQLEVKLAKGGKGLQVPPIPRSRPVEERKKHLISTSAQTIWEEIPIELDEKAVSPEQVKIIQLLKSRLASLELNLQRVAEEEQLRTMEKQSQNPKDQLDIIQVHQELRSKVVQLQLLEARFLDVEIQLKQERQAQKNTMNRLKEKAGETIELQVQLKNQTRAIELLEVKEKQVEDLNKTVATFREENDRLQEAIAEMTSRPFSEESVKQNELQFRQARLEEQTNEKDKTIRALESQIQHYKTEVAQLKKRIEELRETIAQERETSDQMRMELEESKLEILNLQEQLAIFCDHGDKDLLRAIATVVKAQQDPCDVKLLLEKTDPDSIPLLRQKLRQLMTSYEPTLRELQQYKKVVDVQQKQAQELEKQVEASITSSKIQSEALECERDQLQVLNQKYRSRIKTLQAQKRQLVYRTSPLTTTTAVVGGSMDVITLNIWVQNLSLVSRSSARTYIVCDFYDFESQVTPVLPGPEIDFNFNASFECSTKEVSFFQFLHSGSMLLELYQFNDGTSALIGSCRLVLGSLGKSSNGQESFQCEFENQSGHPVATLSIDMTLSNPINELYRMFLADQERLDCLPDQVQYDSMEIEITIASVALTPTLQAASPYVHYRLLGFHEVFTDIGKSNFTQFNHVKRFQVVDSPELVEFLQQYELDLTIFDDAVPENDIGVLGQTRIAFQSLFETPQRCCMASYPVTNAQQIVGQLSVGIRWIKC